MLFIFSYFNSTQNSSFCLVPYDKSNSKKDPNKLSCVNRRRLDSLDVIHSCKYRFIMFTVEFNICLSVSCPGSSMKQRWLNNPIRSIRVSGNERWIDLNQSPANISSVWILILLIFTKSNLVSTFCSPYNLFHYITWHFIAPAFKVLW